MEIGEWGIEMEDGKMKTVVCEATGETRLKEVEVPRIGPEEMLIKVWGCGLCATDVMKVFSPSVPKPVQLGHEVVGEIVEVGAKVEGWAVGERVATAHHVPCFTCQYCRHGNYSMCPEFKKSNFEPGGFSEYVRLPAPHVKHNTVRLPEEVSYDQAVFTEPLACCLRAMKRVPTLIGDVVLIVGLGTVGLLCLQVLKRSGVFILASDLQEKRLALASELGADLTLNPRHDDVYAHVMKASEERGCDLVLLTVISPAIFEQVLRYVRDGGTILIFGCKIEDAPFSAGPWEFFRRELTITTSYSPSPLELKEAVLLMEQGGVRLETLITHRLPLAAFDQALKLQKEMAALKIIIGDEAAKGK